MLEYFSVLEYIGVAAFAMSGVLVGIEYGFDYVGIIFLAIISSVGGGFIRDLSLGITPPSSLSNPKYIIMATLTAILSIIITSIIKNKTISNKNKIFFRKTIGITDAIGLGMFAITSAQLAMEKLPDSNIVLILFVAVITGTGGGIMRDLLANRKPLVLRKEIYIIAAMLGTFIYYYLLKYTALTKDFITIISILIIVAIRIWAMLKNLNIPKFKETRD